MKRTWSQSSSSREEEEEEEEPRALAGDEVSPVLHTEEDEERKREEGSATKKARVQHGRDEEEGCASGWNLLSELPYVPFRLVFSLLLTDEPPQGVGTTLPEVVQVRAQHMHFEPKPYEEGDDEDEMAEENEELKKRQRKPPFYVPERRIWRRSQNGWSSIAALRLTSRTVKHAIDDILRVGRGSVRGGSFAFGGMAEAFGELLSEHLNFTPPLVRSSSETCEEIDRFRVTSEVIKGLVGARLHTTQLGGIVEYVGREWHLAASKVEALRRLVLYSHASIAGRDVSDEISSAEGTGRPLVEVKFLRRDEDFLAEGYGLGITGVLSVALPDIPQERVELWMSLVQCWSQRDEGWDLQARIELVCNSDAWKERLELDEKNEEEQERMTRGRGKGASTRGRGKPSQAETLKEQNEDKDEAKVVPLFDYTRYRGEITDEQPIIAFSLLRQLWHCLAMPTTATCAGGEEQECWTGREVLIALLACLGFAWKPDVNLLWDGTEYASDVPPEEEEDVGAESNDMLVLALKKKREEMTSRQTLVSQFEAFVSRFHHLARSRSDEHAWRVIDRVADRFVAQKRLDRFVPLLKDMFSKEGPWAQAALESSFEKIPGFEIAQRFKVLRSRSFGLAPGEYSSFQDESIEISCPVYLAGLRALASDGRSRFLLDNSAWKDQLASAHLVLRLSSKSAYSYNGSCEQTFITVRAVERSSSIYGTPHSLSTVLARLVTEDVYIINGCSDRVVEVRKSYERDDEIVLCISSQLSEVNEDEKTKFIRAMAGVALLLGLGLDPVPDPVPESDPEGKKSTAREWNKKRPGEQDKIESAYAKEEQMLADNLVRLLTTLSAVVALEVGEGTYPATRSQINEWENDCDDRTDEKEANWEEKAKEEMFVLLQSASLSPFLCG